MPCYCSADTNSQTKQDAGTEEIKTCTKGEYSTKCSTLSVSDTPKEDRTGTITYEFTRATFKIHPSTTHAETANSTLKYHMSATPSCTTATKPSGSRAMEKPWNQEAEAAQSLLGVTAFQPATTGDSSRSSQIKSVALEPEEAATPGDGQVGKIMAIAASLVARERKSRRGLA